MRNLLTAKELAKQLKVDTSTVYRYQRAGLIKNYGVGGSVRFDAEEVLQVGQYQKTA